VIFFFVKAGPYIGPKGGKWSDPQHTIPWGPRKLAKRKRAKPANKRQRKLDFTKPQKTTKVAAKKGPQIKAQRTGGTPAPGFKPPPAVAACKQCQGLGHTLHKQQLIGGGAEDVAFRCRDCNPKGSFKLHRGELKRRGLPDPERTSDEKQASLASERRRQAKAKAHARTKAEKELASQNLDLFARKARLWAILGAP
jgi:hypothetical protein